MSFRKQLTYENRVPINGECHQYYGDIPYALSLPTSEQNIYTTPSGTEETLLKTSSVYGLANFPFATQTLQWATPTTAIETNSEYYQSGPHSGKSFRNYVGSDPAYGFTFSDYLFGQPSTVASPLLPPSQNELNFRGNITSKLQAGVETSFQFDAIDRITRIIRPTMLDEVTVYAEPTLDNLATTFFQDGAWQKRWAQTEADGWNRPVSTEAYISGVTSGIEEIEYNPLGQTATTRAATGSERHTDYDVFGRAVSDRTQGANGIVLQQIDYEYEVLNDGKSRTTQTITRDGQTIVKETVTDFAGRLVETAFNPDRPGAGGPLGSDDYAGGGRTIITHSQNATTGLTTTTVKPYGLSTGNRVEVRDMLDRLISVTDPEYGGGSITYEYNERGLPAFTTQPDGIKYQYLYDAEGRLLEQRQRTAVNPEIYERIVVDNTYHGTYGFTDNLVGKLEDNHSRVSYAAREPDALGRPEYTSRHVVEPLFWEPETARIIEVNAGDEQVWHCRWKIMPAPNILGQEYLLELKPLDSDRASLYFTQIRPQQETDEWVNFTLDNPAVLAAILALPVDHPDRGDWLNEAQMGTQMGSVFADNDYRFRITGIDAFHKSGVTTYWWGDLPELLVDRLDTSLNGSMLNLDFRVFNGGTQRAEPTVTRVFLSQTAELPPSALPVAELVTPAIEPGFAALHGVAQIDVSGYAYVMVVVDANRDIDELQEGNNTARALLA